jgi:hypothetical protein
MLAIILSYGMGFAIIVPKCNAVLLFMIKMTLLRPKSKYGAEKGP